MKKCDEVLELLNEYVDGDLSPELRAGVETHLEGCVRCKEELAALQRLLTDVKQLPRSISPDRDLWTSISARIDAESATRRWLPGLRTRLNHTAEQRWDIFKPKPRRLSLAIGFAMFIVVMIGVIYLRATSTSSWEVDRIAGIPTINSSGIEKEGRLEVGSLLETDAHSRARVALGTIGHVEVGPNSRVRLLDTDISDHRLALDRGMIVASTWAPPRIFSVETPSAVAVDLGCAYRLIVDDAGKSSLLVTAGFVALEWSGRVSIVPAAAVCQTRPGLGPGTPYHEWASDTLRNLLEQFDFNDGDDSVLDSIVNVTRQEDAVTLWHLLSRVEGVHRERVYERLIRFYPLPKGVTKAGVLDLDSSMLNLWWEEFEPVSIPAAKEIPTWWESFWFSLRKAVST